MQHAAAPDMPPATSLAAPDEVVRAMRGDVVEVAFREALGQGVSLLRHMVRARVVSARMVSLQRRGAIGYHSASIGEEAAVVGAVLAMRDNDWVFPGAREWYAAIARGLPLATYVHHAFGSASDPTRGHAAPDHAPARQYNVVPPSGVVGAHLPQAVGAAWAAKIAKGDMTALALCGAEVAEAGDFHNAMNFAGVFKAPVVFVVRASEGKRVADRAVAYGLASARVDGGDVLAVHAVVKAALARATGGKGATLVELVMPCFPDLTSRDDAAFETGDLLDLGADDPLTRLRRVLPPGDDVSAEPHATAAGVRAELDEAIAAAERAGAPSAATLFEHVYAEMPAHLVAQRRILTELREVVPRDTPSRGLTGG